MSQQVNCISGVSGSIGHPEMGRVSIEPLPYDVRIESKQHMRAWCGAEKHCKHLYA